MITRPEYLKLTGQAPEAFKSRARRGLLPFLDERSADDSRKRGQYTAFEALLTLLADYLANEGGVSLHRACLIANRAAPAIRSMWAEISESSRQMALGEPFALEAEILVGEVQPPGLQHAYAVCGTLSEIVQTIGENGSGVVRMTVANISRATTVLRTIAAREEIPLGEFWGPHEVSSIEDQNSKGLRAAVDAVNTSLRDGTYQGDA